MSEDRAVGQGMLSDPLDVLFQPTQRVDAEQRALLAEFLARYVTIDASTGNVFFNEAGTKLSVKQKVFVFLAARLALNVRQPAHSASARIKDIAEQTDAARQYVSEVIRFLSTLGIVRHLSHDNHMLLVKAIPKLERVMLELQDYRRNVFERNRRKYAAFFDENEKQG